MAIPRESPASAHEPYWKSWGFRKDVTVDKFMARLPELAAMGIRTANLDDGWYDFVGDWQPNRAAGKFPGGAADVVRFVQRVHARRASAPPSGGTRWGSAPTAAWRASTATCW